MINDNSAPPADGEIGPNESIGSVALTKGKASSRATGTLDLKPGTLCEFEGDLVEVRALAGSECEVMRIFTGRSLTVPISALKLPPMKGRRAVDLQAVSQADWDRAKNIATILNTVLDDNITSRDKLNEEGKKLDGKPLKYKQLQRLRRRYKGSRLVSSCLKNPPGRIPGVACNVARRDIINSAIDYCFHEKKEATSVAEIVRKANDLRGTSSTCSKVTAREVKRRLAKRGLSLADRNSKGPEKYKESVQALGGKHEVAGPLCEVQIDHTQIDLMILDETRQYCLGRPWLTLVMDVFTRMILGFYLSMKAPSMVSVARAFTIAVLPKTELMVRAGLGNLHWSAMGKPLVVHTDNAAEFTTDQFIRACENRDIETKLRPLGRKHWGGHIENKIGQMMGRLHLLPGTTFRNVVVRGKYDSAGRAAFTEAGAIKYILAQIIEFNTAHCAALHNWSPETAWKESWSALGGMGERHQVLDPRNFYISFLPRKTVTLHPDGYHWKAHTYFKRGLGYPVGSRIEACVDHWDNRKIYIPTRSGDDYLDVQRSDQALSTNQSFDEFLRRARTLQTKEGENGHQHEEAKEAKEKIKREEIQATKEAKSAKGILGITGPEKVEPKLPPKQSASKGSGEGAYIPSANRAVSRRLQ